MSLLEISKKYKTDKESIHNYISKYYIKSFEPYKKTANLLLEIGVDEGQSLEMWNEYFDKAKIVGVDVADRGYIATSTNIEFRLGKAQKEDTFKNLHNIDIIVDDGSHKLNHQIKTFDILFPKLNDHGVYIIEDIKDIENNINKFKNLTKNVKVYDFRKLTGRKDSVIVEIRK